MKFSLLLLLFSLAFSNFKIDPNESSISYTGSHPFHDWKGSTPQMEIVTDCEIQSSDCNLTISSPIASFISGNNNRDSNMLFYVDAFSFPIVSISFTNLNVIDLLSNPKGIYLNGEINFHGIKIIHNILVVVTKIEGTVFITSNFDIKLDDFEINQPTLLMLPIKDKIKIDAIISGEFTP